MTEHFMYRRTREESKTTKSSVWKQIIPSKRPPVSENGDQKKTVYTEAAKKPEAVR